MKRSSATLLSIIMMSSALSSRAATLFWDSNGVSTGCGGAGNWDTTSALWGTACDTGLTTWNNGNVDSAVLGGTLGTVTLTSGITVNQITINTPGYTLNG